MSQFERYAQVHQFESHNGPGDSRPTAMQIVEDNDLGGKWTDKVVLITGCSSGLGIETAKAMKATGAKVYATVRNRSKGEDALRSILEPGRCELLELRLDSLKSVRACAAAFQAKEAKLHVLINNAGIMAVPNRVETDDGFESQIGTNHFGHFLLFQLLRENLQAASTPAFHSRVVNLTSVGHRANPTNLDDINLARADAYSPWGGYANSKTANIWMANEIERRYGSGNEAATKSGRAIHGHSVHPGGIESGLQVHVGELQAMLRDPQIVIHMKSPAQGAATTVWAAIDKAWEGQGGRYLEDCQISPPAAPNTTAIDLTMGHAAWVYDTDGAKKLWEVSNEQVGFKE